MIFDLTIKDLSRAKRQVSPTATTIQTLILSKSVFKDRALATKWVKDHNFIAVKVDETDSSYRYRQKEPGRFQPGSFRTIQLTEGVKAVIGRLKRRTQQRETVRYQVDFLTRSKDEQIVTGIVADRENVDSYGNKISEEEIWKSAYKFMETWRNMGVGHDKDKSGRPVILNDKIKILESWVTREETTIGGKRVPAIAWLLTVRILDQKIWEAVKSGQLTGFSFEAKARRIPIGG